MNKLNIFSSNHTRELAQKVIDKINSNFVNSSEIRDGIPQLDDNLVSLGNCPIETFNNNEISCEYKDSIRDQPVYIFGSTGTHEIMELLLMLDAAKRASASKIYIVLPCYGYARQDKKEGKHKRGPIGAKLVADLLSIAAGKALSGIIGIDLHAESIEGFFDVPFNHISGTTIFRDELKKIITDNTVIASPDAGGKLRVKRMATKLGTEMVGMDKTRAKPGEIESVSLIGDVEGKDIFIHDDIIDTAGTLLKSAEYLITEKKAKSVIAVCTHPVLSKNAVEKINKSPYLSKVIISDTIPLSDAALACEKIQVISSADILAKIIGRVSIGQSMDAVNS